jgi:cell division septation protein DedD
MADEGFHEFHLNGKQLVFLFMSATVVAVVIFLCGVMVGRGVRAPIVAAASAEEFPEGDPTAAAPAPLTASGEAPASSRETLTYPNRLETDDPPVETLKESAAPPTAIVVEAPQPAAEQAVAAETTDKPTAAIAAEPQIDGFVVQVAAVRQRSEADTIARRLTARGYPTFVTTAGGTAARVFRVRVGKYKDRREAESVAGRLEKEEQFKPWITR